MINKSKTIRAIEEFKKPELYAENVLTEPKVDLLILKSINDDECIYITSGLDALGYRELMTNVLDNNAEWTAYLFNAISDYIVQEDVVINEYEDFTNTEEIQGLKGIKSALFFEPRVVALDSDEMINKMNLKKAPLYVFPITDKEYDYLVENGVDKLVDKMSGIDNLIVDIDRKSVL